MAVEAFKAKLGHTPNRPGWHCRGCGREWPCADTRADLGAEFRTDRTATLIYLSVCHADAAADLYPTGGHRTCTRGSSDG